MEFEPFKVKNVSMSVPRGKLVAVVGRVGSGKSSLLQGLIGEMRRTEGTVKFGGSVGYCPQSAWIQNATNLTASAADRAAEAAILDACSIDTRYWLC